MAIPAGASSIDIRQRGYKGLIGDDNYLALKNSQGKYLLNGHFVVSAVERDLAVKGSLLAVWRILRCNPFSKGGFDPVP